MKKVILSLIVIVLLSSCDANTTTGEDQQYLQKLHPTSIVYRLTTSRYIVADSLHVYDICLRDEGSIVSKVKIK